ncbi:MAG: proline--tRNA ligase [Veillonella sp.]|uniref:proline--tRNA ligase n=1 Tax=Veillonella sp. TaxID=1926307 RepID=UPI0025F4E108|nr:proline--tRNA ligase [Veillonella sp.]MBS4912831.1 proline--tRNA ligase [Veillonella sp.]
MLASKLYAPTLRETPADAEVISQKYMLRAGMIRKMAGGLYSYLPLAWKSIRKIEAIINEEMNNIGAQEVMMPILQPAEIWQESGRWNVYGKEMMRIKDRHEREYCLGPTHEEMITSLVRGEVNSYRQLPLTLYQTQNKYRDERRPRYGLMRSREFIMKDAYSFNLDEADLDKSYHDMYNAYSNVFSRCGLYFKPVEADSGAIGGSNSHEFMVLAESGEADVIHCTKCDYAANIEIGKPGVLPGDGEAPKALEIVDTPDAKTIDAVAEMLNLPLSKTMKAVVLSVDGVVVLAMVRGDHDVNEIAVQHAVNGNIEPEMATEEQLEKVGLVGGFISPVGLHQSDDFKIVVDESVMTMNNGCGGANKTDAHYININPERDFDVNDIIVAPIRLITTEDKCPVCGGDLRIDKGIEVGQVFKLGTKYSEAMNATFLNQGGRPTPFQMGSYGIGVSRTLAAAIEQYHDEDGIIWPRAIAPYEVVIVPINAKDEALMTLSQRLYQDLMKGGDVAPADILLDDRNERAGVKFKDADLIGYPLRVTVSKKSLESNTVEVRVRKTGEVFDVPVDSFATEVAKLLADL